MRLRGIASVGVIGLMVSGCVTAQAPRTAVWTKLNGGVVNPQDPAFRRQMAICSGEAYSSLAREEYAQLIVVAPRPQPQVNFITSNPAIAARQRQEASDRAERQTRVDEELAADVQRGRKARTEACMARAGYVRS